MQSQAEEEVVRPKRQVTVPSYLSDYDLTGPGSQTRLHSLNPPGPQSTAGTEPELPGPESCSRASIPCSTGKLSFEDVSLSVRKGGSEVLYQELRPLPAMSTRWQQSNQKNAAVTQQISQLPDLYAELKEMKQQNSELQRQLQSLVAEIRAPLRPTAQQSLPHAQMPTSRGYSSPEGYYHSSAAPSSYYKDPYSHPSGFSDRNAFPADNYSRRSMPHSSFTPIAPQYGYEDETERGSHPRRPHHPTQLQTQESVYRGPKPTIPLLTSPDPREFSRMKIALENILPEDATERYKFQILTDHLRCEEASLVADSYSNSSQPYTDTIKALTKMYGQPNKLALQRIAELMDGPNIRSGDTRAFRLFALNVRSLVGMLEQLGTGGHVELQCGSHVSRLLGKLPYDLSTSFKRFVHPTRVAVPTLYDFAEWLEYELEVQEDSIRYVSHRKEEPVTKKREERRDLKRPSKTTTILLGTEKTTELCPSPAPTTPEPPASKQDNTGKGKAFCPYCDNNKHFLNSCVNFKLLNKEQKVSWIKSNNRCWRCGRGHQAAKCTLKAPCKTCNRRHLPVLHEVNERTIEETATTAATESCLVNTAKKVLYVDRPEYNCKVLLKISKVILRNGDRSMEAYAVLDDGSERTILLHSAAKKLGLKGMPEKLALRTVRQELQVLHGAAVSFAISPAAEPYKRYKIQSAFSAEPLGMAEHTHPVATLQQKYKHLAGLPLHPLDKVHPVLLIGSDCTHLITPIEPVKLGPPGGPAAVRTRLGWTLQGPAQDIKSGYDTPQCLFTSALPTSDLFSCVERLWQMDILPYRSEKLAVRSRQDQEAVDLLEEQTVRVDVDGIERYATPLLRVKNMPKLHTSPEAVLPHLRAIEKRLSKSPEQATAYQAEITKLKEAGYVKKLEPAQVDATEEAWYIPHHIVQHNGKNRVVYNCSFQHQGHTLNELLLPGPLLGSPLLAVLLRFREHATAFSCDIRGMFHQVRLLPADRPLLRFLWRDLKRNSPADVYEWQVLPFGTTCSPCCATFALQKHVFDHSQPGEDVQVAIRKSFYVDNCLLSFTSREDARALVDKLSHLLAEGGFELRQWASNDPSIISHLPPEVRSSSCELWLSHGQHNIQESALGLHWNCQSDILTYKHRPVDCSVATMRNIYKVLASQYDPLGYIVPFTTRAKVLVQRLWDKKREWDDPQLPEELLHAWRTWESELHLLPMIELPRCYTSPGMDASSSTQQIHVFCDASEQAYGAVAYLRKENPEGEVEIAFLAARSRVAPKKQQSIPRLELCAALTGAQLFKVIATELTLPICSSTLWSDSLTVLTWLESDSCRYKVFVGTRVAEIQELTASATWRYVPSGGNPADDITRGLALQTICDGSRWTSGPPFLTQSPEEWPEPPGLPSTEPESEMRRTSAVVLTTTVSSRPDPQLHQTLSSYMEACVHARHGAADPGASITADDYAAAEQEALKQAQHDSFPEELAQLKANKPVAKSSRLLLLAPEIDEATGLIRVGGRLRRNTDLESDTAHPIVLDPRHPLTRLIIQNYDDMLCHPGPERVFSEIRRKYWVLRGREAVRRYQQSCTQCKKWKGKPHTPRMADLPPARQRIFKPAFYSSGVDCFGPYIIKVGRRNEKRWGVLFKCLTSRAVHIDLLTSIDTDAFLMSLRRFVARRGKPYELFCDQGTNFRGGERELQQSFAALHPELQDQLAKQQIKFVFNPPGSPHFGGCWEREIRSLKTALQSTLGAQTVTEEVLRTVLIEIEGILNSKPLGYTSSDVADPDPITPNCLLMGRRDATLPQVVYDDPEILGKRRWRHSQVLADHFWKHFLRHYLPGLQARQKWQTDATDLQRGEVVMIIDNLLPRALWPVGKVTQVFPGVDGRVRSAEVTVKDKAYVRPVVKLISLPALPD